MCTYLLYDWRDTYQWIKWYHCVCWVRCGSVDGSYGAVRNPWRYRFSSTSQHDTDRCPLESMSSSPTQTDRQVVSSQTRDYHGSSSGSVSSSEVHPRVGGSSKSDEDWYIAGGSSGGSAVAVASGVAFAWVSLSTSFHFTSFQLLNFPVIIIIILIIITIIACLFCRDVRCWCNATTLSCYMTHC